MDVVSAVRLDATSLCVLVDTIALRCATGQHLSYPEASRAFLDYVVELAYATKAHLADLTNRLDDQLLQSDPNDFDSQAREIATLRGAWYWLHQYVKPALDAHTLESPLSLVEALAARLRKLTGFENVRFAILHTRDLNYFQLESNSVRKMAGQVQSIVGGAPSFPNDLALVAIPYSQAGSVFLNTALAHEMGHFAFQRLREKDWLQVELGKVLATMAVAQFTTKDFAQCSNLVLDWLEEVYCDLFALYLAGPAFSFAFIDILILTRVEPSRQFEFSHPSDSIRLREQAKILQEQSVGWWSELSPWENSYTSLLEASLRIADHEFSFTVQLSNNVADIALNCFLKLLDQLRNAVLTRFGTLDSGAQSFASQHKDIEEYLRAAVLPSRLINDSGAYTPSAIALFNTFYLFYIDGLDSLLTHIATAEVDCLQCRAYWSQRLQMWLAKSLEDINANGYSVTSTT